MNFAILQLLVKEKIYAWLKKDNMEVKLERYRKQGAKIGGGGTGIFPYFKCRAIFDFYRK